MPDNHPGDDGTEDRMDDYYNQADPQGVPERSPEEGLTERLDHPPQTPLQGAQGQRDQGRQDQDAYIGSDDQDQKRVDPFPLAAG